ncbi:hypothetical protein Barb4_01179 [Bacteroidales bacterium Barb4]|nr:hypothetical protein Barb4_01179 [Bacteroidales bacterium Barb4]
MPALTAVLWKESLQFGYFLKKSSLAFLLRLSRVMRCRFISRNREKPTADRTRGSIVAAFILIVFIFMSVYPFPLRMSAVCKPHTALWLSHTLCRLSQCLL